jgi:hypothetical protein
MKKIKNMTISGLIVGIFTIAVVLTPKSLSAKVTVPYLCVYNYSVCDTIDGTDIPGDKYAI